MNVTEHDRRIFEYTTLRLWKASPLEFKTESDLVKFKKSVKTLLFKGTEEVQLTIKDT